MNQIKEHCIVLLKGKDTEDKNVLAMLDNKLIIFILFQMKQLMRENTTLKMIKLFREKGLLEI